MPLSCVAAVANWMAETKEEQFQIFITHTVYFKIHCFQELDAPSNTVIFRRIKHTFQQTSGGVLSTSNSDCASPVVLLLTGVSHDVV